MVKACEVASSTPAAVPLSANNLGLVVHTLTRAVVKQYDLVPVTRRRSTVDGKVTVGLASLPTPFLSPRTWTGCSLLMSPLLYPPTSAISLSWRMHALSERRLVTLAASVPVSVKHLYGAMVSVCLSVRLSHLRPRPRRQQVDATHKLSIIERTKIRCEYMNEYE